MPSTLNILNDREAELEFEGLIGKPNPMLPTDAFIDPADVIGQLNEMGKIETLRIFINSGGGEVPHGFQIANRLDFLRERGRIGRIETHAEGLVASAATLTFLKGDERLMRNGSQFMIHESRVMIHGVFTGDEAIAMAQKTAEQTTRTTQQALDLYEAAATGMTRGEILDAMRAETFFDPEEAVQAGFATTLVDLEAEPVTMSSAARELYLPSLPAACETLVMTPQLQAAARRQTVESLHIEHDPAKFISS